jgi:hypothetical protein
MGRDLCLADLICKISLIVHFSKVQISPDMDWSRGHLGRSGLSRLLLVR